MRLIVHATGAPVAPGGTPRWRRRWSGRRHGSRRRRSRRRRSKRRGGRLRSCGPGWLRVDARERRPTHPGSSTSVIANKFVCVAFWLKRRPAPRRVPLLPPAQLGARCHPHRGHPYRESSVRPNAAAPDSVAGGGNGDLEAAVFAVVFSARCRHHLAPGRSSSARRRGRAALGMAGGDKSGTRQRHGDGTGVVAAPRPYGTHDTGESATRAW